MQIALIHYSAPPVVGGVESVLAQQARLMTEAGHAVRIVAARGTQIDERIPFVSVPLADSRHAALTTLKVELDAGRVPPEFEGAVGEIEAELHRALAGVEMVIAHNVCSLNKNLALTAALYNLSQKPGAPRFILWHHDLAWTTPRYRSELHAGYPWELLSTAWPGARQVVISELRRQELAALMHLPPETITVVPNGVDLARFFKLEPLTQTLLHQMHLLEAAPILLLPVRVTPRKNIELALRTMAALPPSPFGRPPKGGEWAGGEGKPALVITGPLGPHNPANARYFEQLKTLRAELGLEGTVHFLAELHPEFLPDEVIANFYRVADALFLPSREEGFGLPVLEAAFSRLPVFCADIPPLRAIAGERATYFSPEAEPREVAQKILERLAADAQFQSAVQARQTFTWERVYAQHIAPLLTNGIG